jgi:hypothetical protein
MSVGDAAKGVLGGGVNRASVEIVIVVGMMTAKTCWFYPLFHPRFVNLHYSCLVLPPVLTNYIEVKLVLQRHLLFRCLKLRGT